MTIDELAKEMNLGKSKLSDIIKSFKESNKIERVGKTKGGYWIIH